MSHLTEYRRSFERRRRIAELAAEAHRLAMTESTHTDTRMLRLTVMLGVVREEASELCEEALEHRRHHDRKEGHGGPEEPA